MKRAEASRATGDRGQSLLLSCAFVLIVALVGLATVNLGQAIVERVRLQDSADAAAYSAAALEARAFNVYAFANRTQASHYVSAMVWQSYDSFIYGTEAMLTDLVGLLASMDPCAGGGAASAAVCALASTVPGVGPVLAFARAALSALAAAVGAFQEALEASNPDAVIGRQIVPLHQALNDVLAGVSKAMLESTLGALRDEQEPFGGTLRRNDPGARLSDPASFSKLNACMLARAHSRASGVHPDLPMPLEPLSARARSDQDPTARAKRDMAIIANATRFACDEDDSSGRCPDGFVTHRSLKDSVARLKLLGVELPDALLSTVVPKSPSGEPWKFGQTRLLSNGLARGTEPKRKARGGSCTYPSGEAGDPLDNDLRAYRDASGGQGAPAGYLGQGDDLGADDLYALGVGPVSPLNPFACGADAEGTRCWGNPQGSDLGRMAKESVWALNPEDPVGQGRSIHFRLDRHGVPDDPQNPWSGLGLVRVQHCLGRERGCGEGCVGLTWDVFVANVRPMEETNHPWRGMSPFPNFEPGQFLAGCGSEPEAEPSASEEASRLSEFNQPSVFVLLNEPPDAFSVAPALSSSSGVVTWELGGKAELHQKDDRSPALQRLGPGLNAVARAQVYYHRPGNWQEHPNFFNPHWRARLASVYQGRYAFPRAGDWLASLPAPLARLAQKVLTH